MATSKKGVQRREVKAMGRWGMVCAGLASFGLMAGAQPSQAAAGAKAATDTATNVPVAGRAPMTLDVEVTDKAGQAIPGLKAADFTLLNNGKPVPIESFAAYNTAVAAAPESIILLIDDVNTKETDLIYERQQIGKFLTMNGGHLPVPVSIVLLTDQKVQLVAASSQDGKLLNGELEKLPGLIREMPVGGIYHAEDRMEISLRAMEVMAAFESRNPGRKVLVWISPGWWGFDNPRILLWDKQQKSMFRTIVAASQDLEQARITLDAVSPEGSARAGALHTYLWSSAKRMRRRGTR
jgi:VWFA-related protein